MERILKSIVAWLRSALLRPSVPKTTCTTRHASYAWYAVQAYARHVGARQVDDPDDMEVVLGDLIADLLHLTEALNVDFYEALAKGQFHYRAETDRVGHQLAT